MRELFRRQPRFTPIADDDTRAHLPDDLWVKCPRCGDLAYSKEHLRNWRVCLRCDYHFRLSARERLKFLADEDSFQEWDADLSTADPLEFRADGESYLEKARKTAGRAAVAEAVISGSLGVEGCETAVVVTDFAFMGASMGSVYGEKITRACERCIDENLPLLSVSASGGARMQEGLFSLMQMAKTTAALSRLGEARCAHIALLTDPCYGGVTASYATVADVVLAEPGALVGFAGPRVIEQITRQKLPEGFQTAEFLHEHGLIDLVTTRSTLRGTLATLLELYSAIRPPRRTRRRRAEALEADEATAVTTGTADGA